MSVYTSHWLKVVPNPNVQTSDKQIKEIISELRESNSSAYQAIDEDGNYADICKWYNSTQDLVEFSNKHKDILFCLFCVGDNDEEWQDDFLNGSVTRI